VQDGVFGDSFTEFLDLQGCDFSLYPVDKSGKAGQMIDVDLFEPIATTFKSAGTLNERSRAAEVSISNGLENNKSLHVRRSNNQSIDLRKATITAASPRLNNGFPLFDIATEMNMTTVFDPSMMDMLNTTDSDEVMQLQQALMMGSTSSMDVEELFGTD
jgi:hypothetical protein